MEAPVPGYPAPLGFPPRAGRPLRRPPAAVAVLSGIAAAAAVISLLAALFPLHPESPVALDAVVAAYALALAIGLWVAGDRTPAPVLHAVLISAIALVSLTIAVSATQYGALATAFAYVWMGLYASYFFPPRWANAYLVLIAVGFLVGLAANDLPFRPTVWVLVTSTVLGSSAMLAHLLGKLRRLADSDQLTGLLNRRGLRMTAEPMLAAAARTGQPMTLVALDLDGFKSVNDSYGHHAGDELLVGLTSAWQRELRRGDVLGRNGGDEFVLVMLGTVEDATVLLGRLRSAHGAAWSSGAAQQTDGQGYDELLRAADRALYAAKTTRAIEDPVGAARSAGG